MNLLTAYSLDIAEVGIGTIAVIPIVIALVQACKLTGWVKDKYAPFLAIGFGILIAFLAEHDSPNLSATILNGVIYGLASSGLYSGVQHSKVAIAETKHKKKERE